MSNVDEARRNGGPAFPVGTAYQGLTMRDYFAAKAMQGLLAAWTHGVPDSGPIAKTAYFYADSMLKAREL